MSDALPDDIYDAIEQLSEDGNDLSDAGDEAGAARLWRQALALLPEPKAQWDAAVWLYASVGDAERSLGHLDEALTCFQAAVKSGDGSVNPFALISLGAKLADLGQTDAAIDPLLRAYMLEGRDIFTEFGGDYLDLLAQRGLLEKRLN